MANTRAKGVRLQIFDSNVYAYITQAKDLNYDLDGETIDITNHDDAAELFREFIGGLATGTTSFSFSWDSDNAQQNLVESSFMARSTRDYAIQLPAPLLVEYDFKGIVTSLSAPFPVDDEMMREAELQISGKPVRKSVATFAPSAVDTSTNVLGLSATLGAVTNLPVRIRTTGTMPGGLTSGRVYFATGTDDYSIALTSGGDPINLTAQGTGTHRIIY